MRRALFLLLLVIACTSRPIDDRTDDPARDLDAGATEASDGGGAAGPDGGSPAVTDAGDVATGEFDLTKSGTRLKAVVGKSADGAQLLLGWFDAQRGTKCSPMLVAEARWRCVPYEGSASGYFSDVACTRPLVLPVRQEGPITTGLEYDRSGYVVRVHSISGRHAGAAYAKSGSSCVDVTVGAASLVLYATGVAIPIAEFVEVVEQ